MDSADFQKRFEKAHKLLTEQTTSREKFESVRTLIKEFNPKIDAALEKVSSALSDVEKLEKGEYIELAAEKLPENTEEEKERKKRVLALIRYWKQLTSEVERVRNELSENSESKNASEQAGSFARIVKAAKGPFGIVTIAAVAIVAVFAIFNFQKNPVQQEAVNKISEKQKIQGIDVNGKKVPLSEVRSVVGQECEGKPHYHAKTNQIAIATDGLAAWCKTRCRLI